MKKPRLKVKEHHNIKELREEFKKSKNGRYSLRLQCIIMAKEGIKAGEIEEKLLISADTYGKWIKRYNEKGLEGLKRKKREKQYQKWKDELYKELYEELDKNKGYWTVKIMQKFIEEKHNVKIPEETIRRKIHQKGYSWKTSRPSPYKGDKERQEEFKKNS